MGTRRSSLPQVLESRGISRREFVKFCNLMVATLALPSRYVSAVEKALTQTTRPILVWLEFQDCAGNSESMLRTAIPRSLTSCWSLLVLGVSRTNHGRRRKPGGRSAGTVVRDHKGEYIAVVEGAIPTADDGVYCTIAGRTALEIATMFAQFCG